MRVHQTKNFYQNNYNLTTANITTIRKAFADLNNILRYKLNNTILISFLIRGGYLWHIEGVYNLVASFSTISKIFSSVLKLSQGAYLIEAFRTVAILIRISQMAYMRLKEQWVQSYQPIRYACRNCN